MPVVYEGRSDYISRDQNYLINGNFDFWQRGSSFTLSSSMYTADRWVFYRNGLTGGVYSASQETSVLPNAQSSRCMKLSVGTGASSVGSTSYLRINQIIEGAIAKNLYNKNVTLSFWARSSITGLYDFAFGSSDFSRSYVAQYSINQANTWEYKTISVYLDASSGVWNKDNTAGIWMSFAFGLGSTYVTNTPNVWNSAYYNAITGSNSVSNFVSTTGATFYLSQVMLNEGTSASPFGVFGKSYDDELRACYRYYERITFTMEAYTASGNYYGPILSYTQKRSESPVATTVTAGTDSGNIVDFIYYQTNGKTTSPRANVNSTGRCFIAARTVEIADEL